MAAIDAILDLAGAFAASELSIGDQFQMFAYTNASY